tara:strand:+ start:2212 stop:3168 length:957 start_codon:yes stop_codon:yes gene_type:complete
MNKLICITSHCNTKDKIKTLEANISYLKNEGFNILLLSHLPLNKSILSSVDHFIYNTDNQLTSYPELFQINKHNIQVDNNRVRLTRYTNQVHWAYLNQLKYIGQYCENLNYKHYVIINYDIKITDDMIQHINTQNYNFKGEQLVDPNSDLRSPSNLFFQLCKNSLSTITKNINKKQYVDEFGVGSNSEIYLESLINNSNLSYNVYPHPITEYHTSENHLDHIYHTNYNKENDYFRLFYNKLYIILYGIDRPIKFNIDGVDYTHNENTSYVYNFNQIGYYDYEDNLVDMKHMFNDNKHYLNKIEIMDSRNKELKIQNLI